MNFHYSETAILLFTLTVLSSLLIVGCSHQAVRPELESRKFSRDIGLAGCEVSVPLSRDEVLNFADKLGAPNLGSSAEWAEATSLVESGDHMRHVYCPRNTNNFFGVFRGSSVLFKFGSFIYD